MQTFKLHIYCLITILFFINHITAADYYAAGKNLGCYSSISGGSSKGDYNYQSSGYCLAQCGSSNYVAVKGEECICLNSLPSSSNQESSSSCNVPCFGYGQEMCGGDDSYSIYEALNANNNNDVSSSSNNNAGASSTSNGGSSSNSNASNYPSSSTTSSNGNSQETDASNSSSNESSSITNPPSSSDQQRSTHVVVSTISHDNGSVIYSTITQSASETTEDSQTSSSSSSDSTSTESSTSESSNNNDKSQNKSSNLAPIIGGVVGGVVGAVAIAGALFFFLRYKRNHDDDYYDDEEEFYDDKHSGGGGFISRTNNSTKGSRKNKQNPLEMPMTNPFVHPHDALVDNNSSITDFNNNNSINHHQNNNMASSLGRSKTTNPNFTDPRLNPVMMGRRRLSEGSLVDETDYPRKVLQVANPDRLSHF